MRGLSLGNKGQERNEVVCIERVHHVRNLTWGHAGLNEEPRNSEGREGEIQGSGVLRAMGESACLGGVDIIRIVQPDLLQSPRFPLYTYICWYISRHTQTLPLPVRCGLPYIHFTYFYYYDRDIKPRLKFQSSYFISLTLFIKIFYFFFSFLFFSLLFKIYSINSFYYIN